MLGALALGKPGKTTVDPQIALEALLGVVRDRGLDVLPWHQQDINFRAQLSLLHSHLGHPWPDVSDGALMKNLDIWLEPFLQGQQSLASLDSGSLTDGLMALAGYPSRAEIDRLTPSHYDAPSGSRLPIEYLSNTAVLRVRPQELFGLDTHPRIIKDLLPFGY